MRSPDIMVERIGREGRPLVRVDGFSGDPDALRAAAAAARFEPGRHHYPGVRAALPPGYLRDRTPVIAEALRLMGLPTEVEPLDASFSIVATPPGELSIRQRLPHCDAFARERTALIHYLSPEGGDGTAFFRHRSTGFETLDEARAPIFFGQLEAELRHRGPPPPAYVANDTSLFERIALAEARYDRAYLYHSYALHSGAIAPDATLSPDPVFGRLTVTAFLSPHR